MRAKRLRNLASSLSEIERESEGACSAAHSERTAYTDDLMSSRPAMRKDQLAPEHIAELHQQLRRDSAELDAIMLAQAKSVVIGSKSYLPAKDIADVLGLHTSVLEEWKRDKLIFAFDYNDVEYFPSYALDTGRECRPQPAIAEVLNIFGAEKGGWGCAFWFEAVNGYLNGKTPKETLPYYPKRVIEAAALEMSPIAHG